MTPATSPTTQSPPASPAAPTNGPAPRFGVAYSPAPGDSPLDFLAEAKDLGGLVLWAGDWTELESGEGAPDVLATLAEREGVPFAAQVGFHRAGQVFDDAAQTRASAAVTAYASRHEPVFLVLGVEVDSAAKQDPVWLDAFAPWYADAYAAVKEASPDTLVFPSFQLEQMRGLTGGLFGGPETTDASWELLDRFQDRDATAFTTYPGLVHRDPSDVPPTYYTDLTDLFPGPLVFTEVGWHAGDTIEGWESSDEEQMRFVQRFLDDASSPLDPRFAVWLALHDQAAAPEPFRSMGLVGADGNARTAWDLWRDAKDAK